MPMFVKKGDKDLEIPREIRAKGPKAVEAFVKDGGKAYHAKKAEEAKAKAKKEEEKGADS